MSNWMMSRSSVMSMAKTHTWPLVRKYNPSQYTICLEVALSYNPSLGDLSLCKTLCLKNPFALDDLLISWHIYQSPSFVLQQRFIFILHSYLPLFLLWARDIFSTSVCSTCMSLVSMRHAKDGAPWIIIGKLVE